MRHLIFFLLLVLSQPLTARSEQYPASVGTSMGTYAVDVEVDGDEVTKIYWPGDAEMSVTGAELNTDGLARGRTAAGESVIIEVLGYESRGF